MLEDHIIAENTFNLLRTKSNECIQNISQEDEAVLSEFLMAEKQARLYYSKPEYSFALHNDWKAKHPKRFLVANCDELNQEELHHRPLPQNEDLIPICFNGNENLWWKTMFCIYEIFYTDIVVHAKDLSLTKGISPTEIVTSQEERNEVIKKVFPHKHQFRFISELDTRFRCSLLELKNEADEENRRLMGKLKRIPLIGRFVPNPKEGISPDTYSALINEEELYIASRTDEIYK